MVNLTSWPKFSRKWQRLWPFFNVLVKYVVNFQWEEKVEEGQKEFERISKTIKREVAQYEAKKAVEFKSKIVIYLEAIMQLQQEVIQ